MTMHLEGPWLTTTGKIRSRRRKFASAEAARKTRELKSEWDRKVQEWQKLAPKFGQGRANPGISISSPVVKPGPVIDPRRDTRQYPSRDTGPGVAALPQAKVYTGTKIKGIGTMHKSNAVPIFSDEEAEDIARMRR